MFDPNFSIQGSEQSKIAAAGIFFFEGMVPLSLLIKVLVASKYPVTNLRSLTGFKVV